MKLGRAPRALVLTAATALFAGSIAACSPEPASSGQPTSSGSADAYQALIVSGPVADDATVQDNKWASAVKKAGVLRIGGTETSELFSLLDPASGQVKGFDAAIGGAESDGGDVLAVRFPLEVPACGHVPTPSRGCGLGLRWFRPHAARARATACGRSG